jgi:hypothetical protein
MEDRTKIHKYFENTRCNPKVGPAMYIVSSNECQAMGNLKSDLDDHLWKPIFTQVHPERVVLHRASTLAKRSFDFLVDQLTDGNFSITWSSIFQETQASLMSYNALFRINEELIVDSSCSSMTIEFSTSTNDEGKRVTPYTKAMERRYYGPKELQFKNYRNLQDRKEPILVSFVSSRSIIYDIWLTPSFL